MRRSTRFDQLTKSTNDALMPILTMISLVCSVVWYTGHASPHPGSGASRIMSPKLGFFRSPDGFRLHAGESGWMQTAPPKGNQTILSVYRSPISESRASLTVRVDRLPRGQSGDRYIQRWLKEYPRFGFDVIGTQPFVQNGVKAHVIDLMNRDSKMQLRQVVFIHDGRRRAALLTCRDSKEAFTDTLKACNAIVKTFEW